MMGCADEDQGNRIEGVAASTQVFQIAMVRGDEDQAILVRPGLNQTSNGIIKRGEQLTGGLYVLVMTFNV